ncbi:DNA-3-methyladenine glycosylase 2 family protein [Shewanella sp.]|uniref:DNA-3-methyladenine glycosylase 2 family protein n=1 Tax=Shewanella sp. TaxID=50422 RepID=UPI0035647476
MSLPLPSSETCQRARLSRDARFDGLFFTGVFSTGIYCRPVCPAPSPKEENVRYFATAQAAAAAGLRPCLRCRPESAPGSAPWRGTATTLSRAMALIDTGALNAKERDGTAAMEALAARLGVGSRYLRKLFHEQLGMSPKAYGDYRRLLLAKALLHQTELPITDIAFAAGYGSLRRFNEVFKATLNLTPGQVRASSRSSKLFSSPSEGLYLMLGFRPPYDFRALRQFFMVRAIEGAEWFVSADGTPCYGRTLRVEGDKGWFEASLIPGKHALRVHIYPGKDSSKLSHWLSEIKRVLDVDANLSLIAEHIGAVVRRMSASNVSSKLDAGGDMAGCDTTSAAAEPYLPLLPVMPLPGAGSLFEAGCRAVLGQQVSLVQATKLLNQLVDESSGYIELGGRHCRLFPKPEAVERASLESLKMPGARKLALQALAAAFRDTEPSAQTLLALKGIGPWTVSYACMRGLSEPDVLLTGDLVVRQRLAMLGIEAANNKSAKSSQAGKRQPRTLALDELIAGASPWGSYLTLALWHLDLASKPQH